jgi:hypothetical protein
MTGSAPSVKSTTQSTVDPTQQALLDSLGGMLGGSQGAGSAYNFGQLQPSLTGQYGAPMSQLQQTSLTGIENLVNGYTGGPASAQPGNAQAFSTALNTAQGIQQHPPVSMIDPTAAYQQGVVQPLTQDFNQQVIPSINANYGRSAGGGFSSDSLSARNQAGTNLARTLAQQGSQFTLAADQANQGAQATNAQLALGAATATPGLAAAPLGLDTAQESLLGGGLQAGAVPQATEQTQLTGQYNDFQSILNQIQQKIADALGLSTASTQQTQTVVNPGSTGFLPSLFAAIAGGASRGLTTPGGGIANTPLGSIF